ncbi:MAG: hypothetical protein NWP47_01450 [Rickettsiaceae bacterium]|nr:hypothetical protein [Rickettsiaceae bacterium]
MIKKLSIFLVVIFITAISGWVYLADKFEKIATEEILPKLQKTESLVSIDQDSIVIDKYKFKLTLQNVTAFPNSKLFKIHADKIIVCYNPFLDSLKAQITGDKLTVGEEDLKIYFPSPNHVINFNRSLLKHDLEQFEISILSKDSSIYFANDDKFISKSDDSIITISNSLDNDMYKMHFGMQVSALQVNPESQFLLKVLNQILPNLEQKLDNYYDNYYYDILNETGPSNCQANYSIQLKKDHVHSIIAVLKGEKDIKEVLNEFSFTKDIYSVSISESLKNSSINYSGNISFSGNGEKINAGIDATLNNSYNEGQKSEIIAVFNKNLLNGSKMLSKENPSMVEDRLNVEDFTKISEILTNIDKTQFKIDVEYDIKSNNLQQEILFSLNDFNMKSEGRVNDKVYNGTIEISDPKLLTDSIPHMYENALRPIFAKLADSSEDKKTVDGYDKIAKNIQENGLSSLSALHKGDGELKENSKLVTELIFDPTGFKFKINDKGFFEILTDERIAKFLENLPYEDKAENK